MILSITLVVLLVIDAVIRAVAGRKTRGCLERIRVAAETSARDSTDTFHRLCAMERQNAAVIEWLKLLGRDAGDMLSSLGTLATSASTANTYHDLATEKLSEIRQAAEVTSRAVCDSRSKLMKLIGKVEDIAAVGRKARNDTDDMVTLFDVATTQLGELISVGHELAGYKPAGELRWQTADAVPGCTVAVVSAAETCVSAMLTADAGFQVPCRPHAPTGPRS